MKKLKHRIFVLFSVLIIGLAIALTLSISKENDKIYKSATARKAKP